MNFSGLINRFGILTVTLLFFLVVKIPHLALPYSWDEAWSYVPAILNMADHGPSLLPVNIDIQQTKGHPLLFYFLVSGWITLFSDNIAVVRLLPLLLSLLLLISVHYLFRKNISQRVANIAVTITAAQSLFLAQASLILPEVLLTLLLILSLHFFLQQKWWIYALTASLMTLTKETGLVFAGGFGLFFLLENRKEVFNRQKRKALLWLSAPLMAFILHFVLQYMSHHTFFFKEHLDYLSFNQEKLSRVLRSSTAILFTLYGRNVITAAVLVSIVVLVFRKEKIIRQGMILLLLLLIVLLILFSMVNFYTYRYILPAFPLFAGLAAMITDQAFGKKPKLRIPLIVVMVLVPLFFALTKKGRYDIDFGYADYLPVHQEMVSFCESREWQKAKIAAEFNMVIALRDPVAGYLTGKQGFYVQHLPDLKDAGVVILDSTGDRSVLPEKQRHQFRLVRRFSSGKHWGEVYARISE